MKHATIPVFVPHLACRNNCVFCNQRRISGADKPPDDVYGFLEAAAEELPQRFDEADIAFFGGSFTGIEPEEQRKYLSAAKRVMEKHPRITGLRLSTRPDYISDSILDMLSEYGVTNIELGAQSFDDKVLTASKRGHDAETIKRASRLIKSRGFRLGLQIMPGLPADTPQTAYETALSAVELHPDEARIYPCVVVKDTELEQLYVDGLFVPFTVELAVDVTARIVTLFKENNIKILRVGLHSSDLVRSNSVIAGPFHPAFGELVSQKIYLENALKLFGDAVKSGQTLSETETVLVGRGKTSCMTGRKRGNIDILSKTFGVRFNVREKDGIEEFRTERICSDNET